MSTTFDCRSVAEKFRTWAKEELSRLTIIPTLATVLFKPRAEEASLQYRDLILKDASRLGFHAKKFEPHSESELWSLIGELNSDPAISGILIFYPMGASIPDEDLMDLINPLKDVEGLHSLNLGYLIKYKKFLNSGQPEKCVVPATAKAVVKTLQEHQVPIAGSFVSIINNSMRVGKPLGLMLENLGATVVKCHDKTKKPDLEECVRRADIVVTAVPAPDFSLDPLWIKKGASILDVSYQGNIDVPAAKERSQIITVPENRIGQVTRALLFVNLIYCAKALNALR